MPDHAKQSDQDAQDANAANREAAGAYSTAGSSLESDKLSNPRKAAKVDAALLRLLICPVSRTTLIYDVESQELISEKAGLAYPIRKGIPIMLESEARVIE